MIKSYRFLWFLLTSILALNVVNAQEQEFQLFELRTYHTNDGKLDALHTRFRDHTCSLFEKHGMINLGYWTPEGMPNTLIYLLGYPDRSSRAKSWQNFLNDPSWKKAYKASTVDGKLVSSIESVLLKMTDYSEPPSIITDPQRLFELRVYSANEGKLDALHARFRDHTCRIFEKHGMMNYAYFTPTEEKDGREDTLIYFITHKDKAARSASWDAFKVDENWIKAKAESEQKGKILVRNGVKSVLLSATDYSPVK